MVTAIVEVLELRFNHVTSSHEQNTINFFHRLCVFISNINKDVALGPVVRSPFSLNGGKLKIETKFIDSFNNRTKSFEP